jgi:hypothetical protein
MSDLSSIIPKEVHPSWEPFLKEAGYSLLENIAFQVLNGAAFTPYSDDMLRFLTLDLDAMTVLIL